jgi:DNA repair protein RadD
MLRDYQQDAVNLVKDSFLSGYNSTLLVLPTGGGKTIIFSKIAQQAIKKGSRVLILVHRIELIRQTVDKLQKFGVPYGVINRKFTPNISAPVQVGSVQTLVRRLEKVGTFDLIITDEAHHATAGNYKTITQFFAGAIHLGVTATPIRTDGTGLGRVFENMVVGCQISELIEKGYLTKPEVYAPEKKVDLSGVRIVRGDFEQKEVENLMDKPKIIGNAVEHYKKLCPGEPAVVFCASVNHAKHVADKFQTAGFRAYSVDGSMDDDTRKKILDGLGDGSVEVVTSCDLISEGTDIPEIVCAILLRPTQSTGLYLQQVGRALRVSPGKEKAIILDHVGNTFEHGLPHANRDWVLTKNKVKTGKSKGETEPALRVLQCTNCFHIHEPSPLCPQCGFVHPNKGKTPEEVEGELKKIEEHKAKVKKISMVQEVANAKTMDQLLEIQKKRGYKNGWAHMLYKSRQKKKEKINQ